MPDRPERCGGRRIGSKIMDKPKYCDLDQKSRISQMIDWL